MAFWQRKNSAVYVYTRREGKQTPLPRAETKHLDGLEDHNVQAWVDQWERQYEGAKVQADGILFNSDRLTKLLDDFCAYRISHKKKNPATVRTHHNFILNHAIPFFLQNDPPLKDPNQWPGVSVRLLEHLKAKGLPTSSIQHTNTGLRFFWEYLLEEGVVQTQIPLRLRGPVQERQPTPLTEFLTPDQAWKWAENCQDYDLRLMLLCGYFFSLRPHETFGLMRSDFKGGTAATLLECTKAMARAGRFGRLAVNITRQRTKPGTTKPPKAGSAGWVACFDERAAKLLVDMIRERDPQELLLNKWLPDWHTRRWAKEGIPNVTLKDLRRASLYWLGHHTPLQERPLDLMKHARHVDFDTTLLYLRRPDETVELDELDLDA